MLSLDSLVQYFSKKKSINKGISFFLSRSGGIFTVMTVSR